MRHHRFYADIELAINQTLALPKEASHHCLQVLRYQVDDILTLFNGDGFNYVAQIKSIMDKRCEVFISDKVNPNNESPLRTHFYQGIARGDKMDFIIQKCVELGASEITPLFTEYCNVKLDKKRLDKKQQHWQKVAISACEQSGRSTLVKINPAVYLKNLTTKNTEYSFYLDPEEKKSFNAFEKISHVDLYIGPEGGFSNNDLQQFKQINIEGVSLGPRILRTETAGLACLAILQSRFGDL